MVELVGYGDAHNIVTVYLFFKSWVLTGIAIDRRVSLTLQTKHKAECSRLNNLTIVSHHQNLVCCSTNRIIYKYKSYLI